MKHKTFIIVKSRHRLRAQTGSKPKMSYTRFVHKVLSLTSKRRWLVTSESSDKRLTDILLGCQEEDFPDGVDVCKDQRQRPKHSAAGHVGVTSYNASSDCVNQRDFDCGNTHIDGLCRDYTRAIYGQCTGHLLFPLCWTVSPSQTQVTGTS